MLEELAVIAVVLVMTFISAKIMVKKRLWFAKRFVIGKDSPEKVEELKRLVKRLLAKGTLDVLEDFKTEEEYEIKIKLYKKDETVMTKATVSTERTIVTCSTDDLELHVVNNGLPELGVTILIFIYLLGFIFLAGLFIYALYNLAHTATTAYLLQSTLK